VSYHEISHATKLVRGICVTKNQLDALFILSLFRQSTSTCFGHICSPSSGDILYFKHPSLQRNTCQLYICSITPDDGLQICPKHVEVV